MTTFVPGNEAEVCDVVRWAAAHQERLAVFGSGSRAGFGHTIKTSHGISLKDLKGIRAYDPRELVLTAGAGTPIQDIHAALAERGQQLAFEPPHPGELFGSVGAGTLGGVFLGNQSGPRRVHAGAARDHILGLRAVNGSGELWKSGGKVIKNVTGYDLSKLLAGSWGTLSIVTEISCKVLPVAPHCMTVGVPATDVVSALQVLSRLTASPLSPTGLAWLPPALTGIHASAAGHCLIRFEGTESGMAERIAATVSLLESKAAHQVFTEAESATLWQAVRDAAPVTKYPVVLKLSAPPSLAPEIADLLKVRGLNVWYLDAAGAWIWIGVDTPCAIELINTLRNCLRDRGAVVIMRAPDEIKAATPVLSAPTPALAALTARIKESFDPLSLFNPGRLYPA